MKALNEAWEGIEKLNRLLSYHSLLLSEEICTSVSDWSMVVMGVVSIVGNEIEPMLKQSQIQTPSKSLEEREAAINLVRDKHLDGVLLQMGEIRKELEVKFRAILTSEAY